MLLLACLMRKVGLTLWESNVSDKTGWILGFGELLAKMFLTSNVKNLNALAHVSDKEMSDFGLLHTDLFNCTGSRGFHADLGVFHPALVQRHLMKDVRF